MNPSKKRHFRDFLLKKKRQKFAILFHFRVGDGHFVNKRHLTEISPERYYEEFWVSVTS